MHSLSHLGSQDFYGSATNHLELSICVGWSVGFNTSFNTSTLSNIEIGVLNLHLYLIRFLVQERRSKSLGVRLLVNIVSI